MHKDTNNPRATSNTPVTDTFTGYLDVFDICSDNHEVVLVPGMVLRWVPLHSRFHLLVVLDLPSSRCGMVLTSRGFCQMESPLEPGLGLVIVISFKKSAVHGDVHLFGMMILTSVPLLCCNISNKDAFFGTWF